jgi:hypothetical protein
MYNGKKYSTIDVPGALTTGVHSINAAGEIVFSWEDPSGNSHGALKKGNVYFVYDSPRAQTRGRRVSTTATCWSDTTHPPAKPCPSPTGERSSNSESLVTQVCNLRER